MSVAVIGGGVAGTSAAWEARRRGVSVTLYHHRPGATTLYSGALDLDDADASVSGDVMALASALVTWRVGPTPSRVVTHAGVVRLARGTDAGLLDLAALAGKRLGVPLEGPAHWDGRALARAVAASAWAQRTGTSAVALDVDVVGVRESRSLSDYELCRRHDDPQRGAELASRLRNAAVEVDGWLLGPWLGTRVDSVTAIRERAGRAVGETTCAPGGPAGARFDLARDELLASLDVDRVERSVDAIEAVDERWRVHGGGETAEFDAVVLACGGVLAGGIAIDGNDSETAVDGFRLCVQVPGARCSLDGHIVDGISTLHGLDLQAVGLGALERVGVAVVGSAVEGARGVHAAGDVVAGRPRTALEAAQAGIDAARAAVSGR